jgi:hypothetical protein
MTTPGRAVCDLDHDPVTGALDVDARDRAAAQLTAQIVTDLPVLVDQFDVLLVGVPLRLPVVDDPETE